MALSLYWEPQLTKSAAENCNDAWRPLPIGCSSAAAVPLPADGAVPSQLFPSTAKGHSLLEFFLLPWLGLQVF